MRVYQKNIYILVRKKGANSNPMQMVQDPNKVCTNFQIYNSIFV